jgi:hypothetical protein
MLRIAVTTLIEISNNYYSTLYITGRDRYVKKKRHPLIEKTLPILGDYMNAELYTARPKKQS